MKKISVTYITLILFLPSCFYYITVNEQDEDFIGLKQEAAYPTQTIKVRISKPHCYILVDLLGSDIKYSKDGIKYNKDSSEAYFDMPSNDVRITLFENVSTNHNEKNIDILPRQHYKNTNLYGTRKIDPGVKKIGSNAFDSCVNVEEIILPKTVQMIGIDAFKDCYSLRKINIPDSLEIIVMNPFRGTKNLKISFDNGKNENQYFALSNNYLVRKCDSSIVCYLGTDSIINNIPKSVKIIGEYAFFNNRYISQIDLSETNISTIRSMAFGFCNSTRSIIFPKSKSLTVIDINPFTNIHIKNLPFYSNAYLLITNGLIVDKYKHELIAYVGNKDTIDLDILALEEPIKKINIYSFWNCGFIQCIKHKQEVEVSPKSGLTDWQFNQLKKIN